MTQDNNYFQIYPQNRENDTSPISLGLGSFDGVHLGHQKLIKEICTTAKESNSIPSIITFKELPVEILSGRSVKLLTTLEERINLFHQFGIEKVIVFDFKEIRDLSAKEYLNILKNQLNTKNLILGPDHRYGKGGQGDIALMGDWAKENNISLNIIEFHKIEDKNKISSSQIREYLQAGNIELANKSLGYNYQIETHQIKGEGIGKEIGTPTINCPYPDSKVSIPTGVYAAYINNIPTAINYGLAPTLKNLDEPILECHLLDKISQTLPSDKLKIELVSHIRAEKKFSNVKSLQEQIANDIKQIKELLNI